MPRSSASPSSPRIRRASPPASRTLTETVSPTARRKWSGRDRGRSSPGLLTSSANSARSRWSSTGWIRSDAAVIASRSTPPSRSTTTRTVLARPEPVSCTSKSSRPSGASTGSTAAAIVSRSDTGVHLPLAAVLADLPRPSSTSSISPPSPPTGQQKTWAYAHVPPASGWSSVSTEPRKYNGLRALEPGREREREGLQAEDLGELVGDGQLELVVGARGGRQVGPPALEAGGVPEPVALEVLVGDLGDELDPQRLPPHVLLGVPAAGGARHPPARLVRLGVGPLLPGMPVERALPVRLELLGELLPQGRGEAARHPDVVQRPLVVVQTEEQRPDAVAVLVGPEAGDDAVGGALVLDLEPGAFVLAVLARARLGDNPVETGALELLEPLGCDLRVLGHRGDVDRRRCAAQHLLEPAAPLGDRPRPEVVVALGEEIEGDEARRCLGGQLRDPARGWL